MGNVQVLTDVRIYLGGLDATGQSNNVTLDGMAVDLDKTTFGSGGWIERAGGLKGGKVDVAGFRAYGAIPGLDQVDDRIYADLIGGASVAATLVPFSGAVGALCYVGKFLDLEYKALGKVGDLDPFSVSASTDGPLARGAILHPQGTARTVTGFGAGVQYPAIGAASKMYAALHVLSVTGTTPSLTVILQSDTSNAFSAPTTRATFTAATVTGWQFATAAGAITDTWWRVGYTISGTTPSFLFAASAGIV